LHFGVHHRVRNRVIINRCSALGTGPDEEVHSEPLVEVPPLPIMDRQASER
jgi:hypothetical protein